MAMLMRICCCRLSLFTKGNRANCSYFELQISTVFERKNGMRIQGKQMGEVVEVTVVVVSLMKIYQTNKSLMVHNQLSQ